MNPTHQHLSLNRAASTKRIPVDFLPAILLLSAAVWPSASPVSAEVIWRGDFETGTTEQWRGAPKTDGVKVVEEPVREGKYALRIDGTNAARRGTRDRIEFQHQPEPPGTAEGTERYFGWSVFLPKKLTAGQHALGYFETRNSWRQLMSFEVKGEDILYSTRVPYALRWTGPGKLTPGRWHDFAVHVLWSRDPAKGFVEVWFDGEQVVPRANTATLLDENVAFFQIGLMRDTSEVPETIIIDHVIEATTLAEVTPPRLTARDALQRSLTFHASFDSGLNADFSKGDKACVTLKGKDLVPCMPNDEVKVVAGGGKFGGCLHFPKKGATRPQFSGANVLGYNDRSWIATVSAWLRLTPDEDLEPGYCDPVQIVGDDNKKGYIFLEWSKDEIPRYFRYAIRPLFHIWNPTNVKWADIPFEKRPMVQVERAPFSRDTWTHVAFTLSNINDKAAKPSGSLYINGKLQGRIENWDLTFGWDPAQVALVLGASYVGHLDDLAVFDRALSDAEVEQLFELDGGVSSLR